LGENQGVGCDRNDGNMDRRKGLGEMGREGTKGVQMDDTRGSKGGKEGKAKGGIWLRIRRGLEGEGEGWKEEGLIVREVKWNKETWSVGAVYIKDNVRRIMGRIKGKAEERRGEIGWIVGGDFNARTGEMGALEDGEEGRERKSKDKVINKQGEELIKWVEEEGWGIMNGTKKGDREGEVTFTGGRGGTVI